MDPNNGVVKGKGSRLEEFNEGKSRTYEILSTVQIKKKDLHITLYKLYLDKKKTQGP